MAKELSDEQSGCITSVAMLIVIAILVTLVIITPHFPVVCNVTCPACNTELKITQHSRYNHTLRMSSTWYTAEPVVHPKYCTDCGQPIATNHKHGK